MVAKAELHVHLEGAIFPDLLRKLAARNKIDVPENIIAKNGTYVWNDFLDFLKVYDIVSQVIRSDEDYRDLTYDYLRRCHEEGAIYVEFMPSPDHAELCGLSYQNMMDGITQGIDDARRDFGIEGRIVITCVRHFGVEKCIKVANTAVNNPHPYLVGFAMGGDELGFPPGQFKRAYEIAHDGGLHCTTHAGEWSGPEGVWEAINHLPLKRIGHGVRSIEDPNLISALIEKDIALEVCPGSNISLGVYPDFKAHPFLQLREAGVKVSLSSDDPPFFGTTLGNEYEIAKTHFGLSDNALKDITRSALLVSFADDELKQTLLAKV